MCSPLFVHRKEKSMFADRAKITSAPEKAVTVMLVSVVKNTLLTVDRMVAMVAVAVI